MKQLNIMTMKKITIYTAIISSALVALYLSNAMLSAPPAEVQANEQVARTFDNEQIKAAEVLSLTSSKTFYTQTTTSTSLDLFVNIHTDYPVKIERMLVEEGDWVTKEQPIAILETSYLVRELDEVKANIKSTKAKLNALIEKNQIIKSIIQSHVALTKRSKEVYEGALNLSHSSNISSNDLLNSEQTWQNTEIALSNQKLALLENKSLIIELKEYLEIELKKVHFYSKLLESPIILSNSSAKVHKIYIQEGGDLIEYIPLVTLSKTNLSDLKISIPTDLIDDYKIQSITLKTGESVPFANVLHKGEYNNYSVSVDVSKLFEDAPTEIKFIITWLGSQKVAKINSENITPDSKIITVQENGVTSAFSVKKLHYININTLLIQLPDSLPDSFDFIKYANKTDYGLTQSKGN